VSESRQSYDARALRLMVEELRAEPPPELPWDAIEQRLFSRIERDEKVIAFRPPRIVSPLPRVLGIVAAAAAIALGIGSGMSVGAMSTASAPAEPRADTSRVAPAPAERRVDASRVALAPGASAGQRDLGKLENGDVIEAGAEPVTFARDGLVAWTLAPGSVARVRSMGDARTGVGHTLALERGSISAEVTPRDPAEGLVEAFAVEVQGTRVAVHGTAFSVTVADGSITVDVEHGAVAVGPRGHVGATTGHLLVGPARASFSLDGGRTARMMPRPAAPAAVAVRAPEPAVAAPAAAPIAPAPAPVEPAPVAVAQAEVAPVHAPAPPGALHQVAPPPAQPAAKPQVEVEAPAAPPAPPALTTATILARLDRCFRSVYEPGSSSVQISVSSTFRIQVNDDGSIRQARFDPPLKPELSTCAGGAIAGRFAPGTGNLDIPVSFKP
jgi:hypothetical protein